MQGQTMWFGGSLVLIGLPFVVGTRTVTELPVRCGTSVQRHRKGA